jgi:hypothetical protein
MVPSGLKAQDSQVTVGDNGGMGQQGQGDGKKKGALGKPGYIGIEHDDKKGQGIPNGTNPFVFEGNHEPFCLEAKGTDNDKFYRLKGVAWTFTVTDSNGKNDLMITGNTSNPIVIAPTTDKWPPNPTAGHNQITPDEIDRPAASTVTQAVLTFPNGGGTMQTFNQKSKGHVQFTIHYCDSANGCLKPTDNQTECKLNSGRSQ